MQIALQSMICPCIALIEVLVLSGLSCVVACAVPKLETALVREAADGSFSKMFMP